MDKDKALEAAVTQIERQFGKGSVMRLGDHPVSDDMQFVPTGSLALDIALGVGGIPRGRIIEIFGPESSGKTTMVYHLIAQAQKLGGQAAFIDAEHAMDPIYAKAIGVDVDNLLVSQPDYGEQALEIAEMLVRSGALDIVAIDSVAALTPKAEIEGEMGDSFVGLQARLMSQALRKLNGSLSRSGTICCFTNQLREKIGVMFGNPEVTTGGKALKFYATIRLDIRRIETLKDGTEAVGNRVRVKVVKNKVAPPFKQAEFDITYGKGISREGTLLDLGVFYDVVAKSGAFFSYNDERLGQGRANAKVFLSENPDIADAIEVQIRAKAGLPVSAALAEASAAFADATAKADAAKAAPPRPKASTRSPARSCRPMNGVLRNPVRCSAEVAGRAGRHRPARHPPRGGGAARRRRVRVRRQRVSRGSLAPVQGPRARRGRRRRDPRGLVGRARHGRRVPPARPPRQEPRGASPPAAGQGARRSTPSTTPSSGSRPTGSSTTPRSRAATSPTSAGSQSWGAERIRRGLRELGVDAADRRRGARRRGAERGGDGDEFDRALAVLRRRGAPEQPLDAARRRAFQALQRRGFSSSVAYDAVRRWVEERRRARIDSARRRHVLSKDATCARALCIPLLALA